VALVLERTIVTERPMLFGEVSANFCGQRECRVVSAADLYGRNLGFLDRSNNANRVYKANETYKPYWYCCWCPETD
jgi:hypothetical protein